MPLTEQEREWLERRKNLCERCMYSASGRHCGMCDENFYAFDTGHCNDGFTAAEFEARVAEKLMSFQGCRKKDIVHNLCTKWIKDEEGRDVRISVCPKGRDIDGCPGKDMDTCILRIVRIAVESEMEKEKTR